MQIYPLNQTYRRELHLKPFALLLPLTIALCLLFGLDSLTSHAQSAGTPVGGTITANTTWTQAASPYVLTSTVTIDPDVVLTIQPGTIVKSQSWQIKLRGRATLNAVGTASEPIVFTSLKDDEVGGDTNGDGAASAPNSRDWSGIVGEATGSEATNASTLNLQFVTVRYANGMTANGNLTLHDSRVEFHYNTGVYISPGENISPTISIQRTAFLRDENNLGANRSYMLNVNGQPGQLTIQDNSFTTSRYEILQFRDVSNAQISGNTITQNSRSSNAVLMTNVASGVAFANNTISGAENPTNVGVEMNNSAPDFSNNVISGFQAAVVIEAGYPQTVPTYNGNNFSGNRYSGVGLAGTISGGTWTSFGGHPHFIYESSTVESDATLTIPAGAIIKFTNSRLSFSARATLTAIGTESEPIVFTSIADDTVGGDSNNDGATSTPESSGWTGILGLGIGSGSAPSTLNLQYVNIRYANTGIDTRGDLTIQDSTFEETYEGISVLPTAGETPTISILRNTFRNSNRGNNDAASITVSRQPGQLTIQDNTFVSTYWQEQLWLANLTNAQVSGNSFTHNRSSTAILLDSVTEQVVLSNNTITGNGESTEPGILIQESSPTLSNNTISNFQVAISIDGGYPELVPSYSDNNLTGNTWTGIGVQGVLKSGTWTDVGGHPHFIYDDATVEADATLTIPAGTIIKSASAFLRLNARATLNAVGTAESPIIFTSINDDSVGGDSNNDGSNSSPAPRDWFGLIGEGAGGGSVNASTLNLQHVTIRYASLPIQAKGNLNLHDSLLESTYSHGVTVLPANDGDSPTVSIQRTTFREMGSQEATLYVEGKPAQLIVQENVFAGNSTNNAIELVDVESAQITGNTITQVGTTAPAIFLTNVLEQVVLSNNSITGNDESTGMGIFIRNGTPTISNNTITNFEIAAVVRDGYPQTVPIFSNNTLDGNRRAGIGIEGILTSGTWDSIGGHPLSLWGSAILEENETLTIPPGTVIKGLSSSLSLKARATLNAVGTESEPIIFTSIKDDTAGGDSNGDGAALEAQDGDWVGIVAVGSGTAENNSSTLNLQHVIIRYAQTAIKTEGNLTLHDSAVEYVDRLGVHFLPVDGESPAISIQRTSFRNENNQANQGTIYVTGQPGELTIQGNTFSAETNTVLRLLNLSSAQIAGNTLTFNATNGTIPILLENVEEQVLLSNNTITGPGNSSFSGIEVTNGAPNLTGNSISGFGFPIVVDNGYPQRAPTYDGNTLTGNQWNGVGVTGILKSGTWSNMGSHPHFLHQNAFLEADATLSIPAGTVIKVLSGGLTLEARSTLNAVGTASEPIVFTSIKDDTIDGDSNNDGGESSPAASDWSGLFGRGTGSGSVNASTLNLQHVTIRYARDGVAAQGNLSLQDSLIGYSGSSGVFIVPADGENTTVSIARTAIYGGISKGIQIDNKPTTLTLTNNAIFGHGGLGLFNNAADLIVDATGTWWGDPSGPTDSTNNPDGQGDTVSGNVNYASWLTEKPAYAEAVGVGDENQNPTVAPTTSPILPTPTGTPSPIATPENIPTTADTFEGDNDCSIATSISTDGSNQEHNFDRAGDTDWLKFEATAGQTYRVEVQTRANSVADVNLEVYDVCDGPVTNKFEETFTPGVRLDLNPTQSGTIYLKLSNYDANLFGADAVYSVSVRQLKAAEGAVILVEGRLKKSDRLQSNIYNVVQRTYELFKASGYSDDDIHYLTTNSSAPGYDDPATADALRSAITTWAAQRVGPEKPLTIYLMDHGNINKLYLDEPNGERVTPSQLDSWLNELEDQQPGVKLTIIVEACHSGSFIQGDQSISKAGRLVITSTNVQNVAYASAQGAQFSDRFLTSLQEGYGLSNSFWDARNSVRRLYKIQDPWIDANGNGIPNEPDDGGEATSDHNPNTGNQPADTWAPYIVRAEGPLTIENGRGTLRAEVRDNKSVAKVWAAVYGPSYRSPESVEELVPEDVPTATFSSQGSDIFSVDYSGFNEKGTYQIALYAEDNDGLKARLMVLEVQNGEREGKIYMPLIRRY
ncbi:MAG: right-handed parallel beta-helix repeat-containing protein [Chloroflexota bacterium]